MEMDSNEIIYDILLKMKYDNRKTLSENCDTINEQKKYYDETTGNWYDEKGRLVSANKQPTEVSVNQSTKPITSNSYCQSKNLNYDSNTKKCFLPVKTQEKFFSNYGIITGQGLNYFIVDNQNDWLAVAAVYIANEVENQKYMKWGTRPHGRCKCKDTCLGRVKYDGKLTPPLMETLDEQNPFVCYNETVAFSFDNIDFTNITSTEGRLNRSSFRNYNGYIPSWGEISQSYGSNNLKKIINKLDERFVGGSGWNWWQNEFNGQIVINSKNLTSLEITTHDLLGILAIGTMFIPYVGPFLSVGIGMADAGLYYKEGDYGMAALAGGLTLAFDVPGIASVLGKILGSTSKQIAKGSIKNIVKGMKAGDLGKLTAKEYEVVKAFEKNSDLWGKEIDKLAKSKSKQILDSPKMSAKLKPKEITTLKTIVGTESATKGLGGLSASVWGGVSLYKKFSQSFDEELNNEIEKAGFSLDGVVDAFGFGCYEGMDELACRTNMGKLKKLWSSGWRPLNTKTMKVNQVPISFQTDKYKNDILPNQLSQDYKFMENMILRSIEQASASNAELKKQIDANKSYKSTNPKSKEISSEELAAYVID